MELEDPDVALETLPGFYCTGNLYRPSGRTGAGSAILCPHGHFRPLGRFREDQQIRCAQFARMGAIFSERVLGVTMTSRPPVQKLTS